MPFIENLFSFRSVCIWTNLYQVDVSAVLDDNFRFGVLFNNLKEIPVAVNIVTLSRDHLSLRFSTVRLHFRNFFLIFDNLVTIASRTDSVDMSSGADIRTLPSGGKMLICKFLMSFLLTSNSRP